MVPTSCPTSGRRCCRLAASSHPASASSTAPSRRGARRGRRAMDAAMGVSGGGLKTAPVPHLGQLADPRGGSGNWFIRHVEGNPIMSDEGTHGFSGLRTGKTPDQMSYTVQGAPTPQRPVWDIADLEGKDLIFGVKDRTAGGGLLSEVGGRKLRNPVPLEAGA